MNPRGKDSDQNRNKFPKINTSPSRQWSSSFKNPRIVRVSRAFGGKDRHSKVCTVRGLRDRRIRLSVPTAIQLYDLQERLGLGQPSKVVDWLIEATKDEIDKLPPLPMMLLPSNLPLSLPEGRKTIDEKENIGEGFGGSFVEQNFFPMPNTPYNYNFHWDNHQPNMPLSQFGGGFPFLEEQYNSHVNPPFPSSYINPQSVESDQYLRQMQQNSTTLHLISPTMKSFSLSMNNPDENDNRKPEKDN